jgi:hypothetical protein
MVATGVTDRMTLRIASVDLAACLSIETIDGIKQDSVLCISDTSTLEIEISNKNSASMLGLFSAI